MSKEFSPTKCVMSWAGCDEEKHNMWLLLIFELWPYVFLRLFVISNSHESLFSATYLFKWLAKVQYKQSAHSAHNEITMLIFWFLVFRLNKHYPLPRFSHSSRQSFVSVPTTQIKSALPSLKGIINDCLNSFTFLFHSILNLKFFRLLFCFIPLFTKPPPIFFIRDSNSIFSRWIVTNGSFWPIHIVKSIVIIHCVKWSCCRYQCTKHQCTSHKVFSRFCQAFDNSHKGTLNEKVYLMLQKHTFNKNATWWCISQGTGRINFRNCAISPLAMTDQYNKWALEIPLIVVVFNEANIAQVWQ